MITEDQLLNFFIAPGREKRLAVLDLAIEELAKTGDHIYISELLEIVPWYAEHHSVEQAAAMVVEVSRRDFQ